jgi:3-oxoadipate enol-lactonase
MPQQVWHPQLMSLKGVRRVVLPEYPGHGLSKMPAGRITLDRIAAALVDALDALAIARVHLVGLSLGGCLGVVTARQLEDRAASLTVVNARLHADTAIATLWQARARQARELGMNSMVDAVLQRWFTPCFLARKGATVNAVTRGLRSTRGEGFAACCEILSEVALRPALGQLSCPVRLVAGESDAAVPADVLRSDGAATPGSTFELIPGPHLCNLEEPEAFNAALRRWVA